MLTTCTRYVLGWAGSEEFLRFQFMQLPSGDCGRELKKIRVVNTMMEEDRDVKTCWKFEVGREVERVA